MLKIVPTEDGSSTIYLSDIDETYHSVFGAIQESEHIFINAAFNQCNKKHINLLEIGFGTGLNAYLTLLEAEKQKKTIHFTSLELYPIQEDIYNNLNFANGKDKELFTQLHSSIWEKEVRISEYFYLTKIKCDFTEIDRLTPFDVCYFDAFSPDKQPYMWQYDRFELLYQFANQQAILTTYCAKGEVRRCMQKAGFKVERLPGPKGKREILRAVKVI